MSLFLIHQVPSYAVLLADSLAAKYDAQGVGAFSMNAPKLVHVAPGIYAAHAGTWQPALAMLSDLSHMTKAKGSKSRHVSIMKRMQTIALKRYKEYQSLFGKKEIDVRIALVVTGHYRHPADVQAGCSSSILLWEAARNFAPLRVEGRLFFACNAQLSTFAHQMYQTAALKGMAALGPLAAAQSLKAIHAAVSEMSNATSKIASIALIGSGEEHSLLQGSMVTLPCEALIAG